MVVWPLAKISLEYFIVSQRESLNDEFKPFDMDIVRSFLNKYDTAFGVSALINFLFSLDRCLRI
jgi:hypothetical protein